MLIRDLNIIKVFVKFACFFFGTIKARIKSIFWMSLWFYFFPSFNPDLEQLLVRTLLVFSSVVCRHSSAEQIVQIRIVATYWSRQNGLNSQELTEQTQQSSEYIILNSKHSLTEQNRHNSAGQKEQGRQSKHNRSKHSMFGSIYRHQLLIFNTDSILIIQD